MVGFEDEAEKIIGYLTNETEELDVISIIGMAGSGKTTLAEKIFHDPDIQHEFPIRIWVYAPQEFTSMYDFLYTILKEFTGNIQCIENKSILPGLVASYLELTKFLLVMDDLWSCDVWDYVKLLLFPKSNNMGKILITSREAKVGRHVKPHRSPYMLRCLTSEESCLLFQLEVFCNPSTLEKWKLKED